VKDLVRRVGQRFMVGFEGHTASADVKALIREFGVGHVVLFARNVAGPEQVAELVRELQSVARDASHERPLLVAVDQEGGRVARLREPWTLWPAARAVGRAGSEETARQMGAAIAEELSACGIRYDFAPCVDVDTNPKNPVIGDRSFGEEPRPRGAARSRHDPGLQENGVAAAAKHFPGHGDTDLDSHLELPAVDHSRARLDDVELRPFRMAIAAGVASVMTSHILVREIDDARPATLSPPLIAGLLRQELGHRGVVVTDDLEMKAVAATLDTRTDRGAGGAGGLRPASRSAEATTPRSRQSRRSCVPASRARSPSRTPKRRRRACARSRTASSRATAIPTRGWPARRREAARTARSRRRLPCAPAIPA